MNTTSAKVALIKRKIKATETAPEYLLREQTFHDEWAETEGTADFDDLAQDFTAPLAIEHKYILTQCPDLKGRTILDVGSGLGEAAAYFTGKGAKVTALDISEAMLERLKKIFQKQSEKIDLVHGNASHLPFPDGSFDIVYAENVIHHLPDKETFFAEVNRVLKPSGYLFTVDPLIYNPIINVYRLIARKVRSDDERALQRKDLKVAREIFPNHSLSFFWFFSLSIFLKFFLIDRLNPNFCRYWKKILEAKKSEVTWVLWLHKIDQILLKVPIVQWLSWNVVFVGRKK